MQRSPFKEAASTALALTEGSLYSRNFGHGARVVARSGTVWVTQSGDQRDILLHCGEAVLLPAGAEAVISSLGGPARLEVEAFEPARTQALSRHKRVGAPTTRFSRRDACAP